MKGKTIRVPLFVGVFLSVLVALAMAAQDRYTVKVPNGLAFSEFKGYEDWQAVGASLTDSTNVIRLIVANPVMIDAYKKGVPGNGKPFPEGSKIAKIEWRPKEVSDAPFSVSAPDTVPGDLWIADGAHLPDRFRVETRLRRERDGGEKHCENCDSHDWAPISKSVEHMEGQNWGQGKTPLCCNNG